MSEIRKPKEDKRSSRRNDWIQKRWKSAMQSVRTIGFKTFEEILHKEDHSCEREDHSADGRSRRSTTPNCHFFLPLENDDDENLCYVCEEIIDRGELSVFCCVFFILQLEISEIQPKS